MTDNPHHEAISDLLLRELHRTLGARLDEDADLETVTADLTERLQRVRAMRCGPPTGATATPGTLPSTPSPT